MIPSSRRMLLLHDKRAHRQTDRETDRQTDGRTDARSMLNASRDIVASATCSVTNENTKAHTQTDVTHTLRLCTRFIGGKPVDKCRLANIRAYRLTDKQRSYKTLRLRLDLHLLTCSIFSLSFDISAYRERKCADTIGTVPVPWAGHFQC